MDPKKDIDLHTIHMYACMLTNCLHSAVAKDKVKKARRAASWKSGKTFRFLCPLLEVVIGRAKKARVGQYWVTAHSVFKGREPLEAANL